MSRSLADSYLKTDGTPITEAERTKTFVEMFDGRDPRMAETIMYPGFINEGQCHPAHQNRLGLRRLGTAQVPAPHR